MGVFDSEYFHARAVYALKFFRKQARACIISNEGGVSWHGFSSTIRRNVGARCADSFLHACGCPGYYVVRWFTCRQRTVLFLRCAAAFMHLCRSLVFCAASYYPSFPPLLRYTFQCPYYCFRYVSARHFCFRIFPRAFYSPLALPVG